MQERAVHDPSWAALRAHSARLFRRARRHLGKVLGGAALITLMALAVTARRPVRQTATAVLRMTEDIKAPIRMPWTDRALRGYVTEVAFSHTQLLAVIQRHRMFRGDGKFDPIAAVETFRERIEVEVVQNHAIALVERDHRPRSAHVKISYADGDPERALAVARELGELLVATGRRQQRQQVESAVRMAAAEAAGAQAALQRLRLQATSSFALAPYQARSTADIPGLRDALRTAQARVDRAEEVLDTAERHLRGDADQSGLEIDQLETVPAPPPWPVRTRLEVVAATASLLCLPLAALIVGAWDRRLYTAEDLQHLGARCLGHLSLGRSRTGPPRPPGLTKEET
jgi:hypothetical protein